MAIYHNSTRFRECKFEKENEFEKEVIDNYVDFFGKNTVYIEAKEKIKTKIGNTIPDGFLFDLTDINDPVFYIVEIELASHNFYEHIFPQITKFIGYINSQEYDELTRKLWEVVKDNSLLKKRFGDVDELYKFISDTINKNSNILLIIDDIKPELQEINSVYQEWSKRVKQMRIKKYIFNNEAVYDIMPEFRDIEDTYLDENTVQIPTDEDFHLTNTNENVKQIYARIKQELGDFDKNIVFNPQKHYISIRKKRNFAFFKFRKSRIKLIVKRPFEYLESNIKRHLIQRLSESVQKFYLNKPNTCSAIILDDLNNIDEVINILKELS